MKNHDVEELKQFLPFHREKSILAIQVNSLDCGGIVVGVSFAHDVADGASMVMFLTSWAAKCSGTSNIKIKKPNFDLALHFPPQESWLSMDMLGGNMNENIVTKRLVFDKSMISSLKKRVSLSEGKDPTRVEAVSISLWTLLRKIANSKNKRTAISVAVNLRPRMSLPDSESDFIGNFFWSAMAVERFEECCSQDLLGLWRKSTNDTDKDYMKKIANVEDFLNSSKKIWEMLFKEGIELYLFSSWCSFPLYGVDFGWGSPCWVCTTNSSYKNVVVLISTSSGDGIEAWIRLLADDIAMLERDEEFLSLFSHQNA